MSVMGTHVHSVHVEVRRAHRSWFSQSTMQNPGFGSKCLYLLSHLTCPLSNKYYFPIYPRTISKKM